MIWSSSTSKTLPRFLFNGVTTGKISFRGSVMISQLRNGENTTKGSMWRAQYRQEPWSSGDRIKDPFLRLHHQTSRQETKKIRKRESAAYQWGPWLKMKAFKESKKPRHSLYLSGKLQALRTAVTSLGATMGGPGFKVKVKTYSIFFGNTSFQVKYKELNMHRNKNRNEKSIERI